jgi:P4 family phage/plasmid primase-like protien
MYDLSSIKSKLSCVEYARAQGLPVHKSGDRCASPFHAGQNKTSMIVYDQFWYSHSDQFGGDVIDLCALLKHDGNRGRAIRELAALTGCEEPANASAWKNYTQNLGNAVAAWHENLTQDDRDYLHSRGITDETADALMLGRCTAPGHRGRLVIPYAKNGYYAYYCTRERPGCQSQDAKYKKQAVDDFNEHVVWGLDTLGRSGDTLIIAEGAFDAMSFYQGDAFAPDGSHAMPGDHGATYRGYPVISAITGIFSAAQLPTVLAAARSFKRVFMVYDNDPRTAAGTKFTIRTARILARERIPFTVGIVPNYHDVSEYYAAGGRLDALVDSGTDGLTYLLSHDPEIQSLPDAAKYSGAICDYLNDGGCDAVTNLILRLRSTSTEIEAFMYSIARYTRRERLSYLFDQLQRQGEYSNSWLRGLLKSVSQAPSERIVADYINAHRKLIYCTGTGFYEYVDGVWCQRDDLTVKNYAIQYLGVFATDQRANAAKNLLKSMCLTDVEFNTAHVWNFINGTLELDTGVFREANPLDYCSIQMRYPYNPDAPCAHWTRFIRDITAEDEKSMEILQFIAGYVLFSECPLERIFYLVGGGANGKSKFLDILVRLFGEQNCTSLSPTALTKDFQLAQLHASVLNICEEISGSLENTEELLKSLSSGGIQNACFKHMPYFSFRNRAKLVFASNEMPSSRDTSDGMARRLIIVNFPVKFVENPDPNNLYERQKRTDVTEPLLAEIATGGIFNWVYAGYKLLREVGYFTETDDQEQLMEDFREVSNPVLVFWRECIEPSMPEEIGTIELYGNYRKWCEANGNYALSRSRFHVEFKKVAGKFYERAERTERYSGGSPRKFRYYFRLQ